MPLRDHKMENIAVQGPLIYRVKRVAVFSIDLLPDRLGDGLHSFVIFLQLFLCGFLILTAQLIQSFCKRRVFSFIIMENKILCIQTVIESFLPIRGDPYILR